MAASAFKVANGLTANGDVTLSSTGNAATATNGKILGLDANGKIVFRTHANLQSDLGVSSGDITAVTAGNGMDFSDVTSGSASVVLGDPSTLTVSTTDGVTSTSHTHAITASANPGAATSLLKSDSSGALQLVNLTLSGDLTVQGTTTTVSTTNTLISDKLLTLNDGGGASSGTGAGIEIEENGSATGFIKTDGTGDFTFRGAASAAAATMTLDINATKTITVAGALSIEADSVINQDLSTDNTPTFGGMILTGGITMTGQDLGSASAEIGDIYIADDKKIKFGNGQDVTIEYDEDGTDSLLIAGGDVTLSDDKKLYFGTGKDISLEYDEDGTDRLSLAGGNLLVTSTNRIEFNDATQYVYGINGTTLGIVATDEVDITATTLDFNGAMNLSGVATLSSNAVIGGNIDHNSIVTTKVSSQSAISNGASAFLFEEAVASFTSAEVLLQIKGADGTKQTNKVLIDYDGSAVSHTQYATLGHAIGNSITVELTNGSGSSGSSHFGLKLTNSDSQNITVKSIRQLIAA